MKEGYTDMTRKYKPEGMLIHTPENRLFLGSAAGLERAMATGAILEESALMCDSGMNLHLDLGGIEGIIPREEAVWCRTGEQLKDIAVITRVGKPVCFKIMSVDTAGGKTVAHLSRREAQRECAMNYIADLIPGDIIQIKITHLESFGAFADIGCGISSLLPVDSLSVSRISHPRDRLFCGGYAYAVVKTVDPDTGRLYLSQKELLGTWEENAALFAVGQTVPGIVRSIENYGVFFELTPNLAGLAEPRIGSAEDELNIGDTAAVYIKSIIPERMKVKLVLIDAHTLPQVPAPIKYFVDCEKTPHMDIWRYSPAESKKVVETVF